MTTLAFYVGGVSSAVFGAVESAKFAHVIVGVPRQDHPNHVAVHTVGEISTSGDSNFGKLENKIISYGSMVCNTEPSGVRVGADADGRALPLVLAGKFIEIEVDSGTTFSGFNRVATKFKASDMDPSGNKGAVLFEFDGIMRIWSDTMSSDAKIAGRLKPINGDARLQVANQVLNCEARNY